MRELVCKSQLQQILDFEKKILLYWYFDKKFPRNASVSFVLKHFSCAINEGLLHNETLLLAAKNDKPCQHFKKNLKISRGPPYMSSSKPRSSGLPCKKMTVGNPHLIGMMKLLQVPPIGEWWPLRSALFLVIALHHTIYPCPFFRRLSQEAYEHAKS